MLRRFRSPRGTRRAYPISITCTDPPGGRILFFEDLGGERWISAVNSDGTGKIKLANVGSASYLPSIALSPDGEKVAFSTFGDLYLMNKDASDMAILSTVGGMFPSWSLTGQRSRF